MASTARDRNVFVNCPFDERYQSMFEALVFAIYELGFVARCAREEDDSGVVRFAKIERIIREFGIHDVSEVRLDGVNNLPRFNMPLEPGMFLGCKGFGGQAHKNKVCLIRDVDRYRYQKFISDIAGHDIRAHKGEPAEAIKVVRNWLATSTKNSSFPGGAENRDAIREVSRRSAGALRQCETRSR